MCFGNCDRSGMDLCRWGESFCRNAVDKGKWKGTDCNYSGEKGNGEKDYERIKYLMLY